MNLTLFQRKGMADRPTLEVAIPCGVFEWQLSTLAQFCSSSLPPLPTLEHLTIHGMFHLIDVRTYDMESSQWLELLHPFVAVRDLVLLLNFRVASQVATALRELTGSTVTEVLPALRRVFVGPFNVEPIQEALAPFITARQLSGQPVSVHHVEPGTS